MARIPLIKPYVTDEVKARVCEVLDSGHLTEGGVTRELEEAIKNYIGCNYTIAVSNCTVGLEIALKAVGVGPGDEVIVPGYTFMASPLSVAITRRQRKPSAAASSYLSRLRESCPMLPGVS